MGLSVLATGHQLFHKFLREYADINVGFCVVWFNLCSYIYLVILSFTALWWPVRWWASSLDPLHLHGHLTCIWSSFLSSVFHSGDPSLHPLFSIFCAQLLFSQECGNDFGFLFKNMHRPHNWNGDKIPLLCILVLACKPKWQKNSSNFFKVFSGYTRSWLRGFWSTSHCWVVLQPFWFPEDKVAANDNNGMCRLTLMPVSNSISPLNDAHMWLTIKVCLNIVTTAWLAVFPKLDGKGSLLLMSTAKLTVWEYHLAM